MSQFNHLVVPTDFSPASLTALRYAAEIARKQNGQIHLVHVYEKPYMDAARNGVITAVVDQAKDAEFRAEVEEQVAKIAKEPYLQGLQVFRRLISDITPWRFFEKLDAQKSDIIVMGTRGYTGLLADTFIGTNAQRVIRYSPFPVLSIPEDVEFNGIKKVMIATDFKDDINTMVKGTIAFAKLFDAEVDVVMINTRNNYNTTQYAKDQFHKLVEQHPYHKMALFVHNAENVEEGIKEMVFSNNIDVISMLTHGRTGLQHLLVGSIAESVSSHIRCPLLTFRLQQD